MSVQIHKAGIRARLAPRSEPYWGARLGPGRYIGLRKIDGQRGSWIARYRDEASADGRRAQHYKSLGDATEAFDYDAACKAALAWFKEREAGVRTEERGTVAEACRAYVEDRRQVKGEACAHDAEKRFERTVYSAPLGAVELAKLRTPRIKAWRDELELSKGSANRTLTSLKAALNLAVANRLVSAEVAREWDEVKPYKGANKRRTLFLDLSERRALLGAATGAVKDLIEAVMHTGCRAGELVNALRSAFDARLCKLTVTGKTGTRDIPLSPAAVAFFKRVTKDKLPTAHLLTRDDGKRWEHSDWDELVRAAAEKAKLPQGCCLYTLRHSWISEAISGGMTTLDVARLCGTSVAMIEKYYGHLVAGAVKERLAAVVML
jgi:integrase